MSPAQAIGPHDLTESPGIGKGLRISVAVHSAAVLALIIKSLVFPGEALRYTPTLRVDLVGLPDQLKNDRPSVPRTSPGLKEALEKAEKAAQDLKAPKVPVIKEQADPNEMVLKPKKAAPEENRSDRLKNALARAKALSRIQSETAEPAAPAEPVVIKGNQISKGSSLEGDAREGAEAGYFDRVRDSLSAAWALPVWLARQKLSAQVEIHIDSRGRIERYRFIKGSGNAQFDDQVKKTLQEAQPLPAPPQDLASRVLSDGIIVGFPL